MTRDCPNVDAIIFRQPLCTLQVRAFDDVLRKLKGAV